MRNNLYGFVTSMQEKSKGKRHVITSNGTCKLLAFNVYVHDVFKFICVINVSFCHAVILS